MMFVFSKNKTNHPISSNSHPSATANKAIHSLKQWVAGSIPGRGIYFHFEYFAYFPLSSAQQCIYN